MSGFMQRPRSKAKHNRQSLLKELEKAVKLQRSGYSQEAQDRYMLLINEGLNHPVCYANLAVLLKQQDKLADAEKLLEKAIGLKPDYAEAHLCLGNLYLQKGQINKSIDHIQKALEFNKTLLQAYITLADIYRTQGLLELAKAQLSKALSLDHNNESALLSLGSLQLSEGDLENARENIKASLLINPKQARGYFTLSLITDKKSALLDLSTIISYEHSSGQLSQSELIDLGFAKANCLHRLGRFEDAAESLLGANNLKLQLYPSDIEDHMKVLRSNSCIYTVESNFAEADTKCIFIVGLPRCGSTLLETILSMNPQCLPVGESLALKMACIEHKKFSGNNLYEGYRAKLGLDISCHQITIDKMLYNYQFIPEIIAMMPFAKIIFCTRNPLDQILSIYRAHFSLGNRFSSSLVDSANLLVSQRNFMASFMETNRVFHLDYDSLVVSPRQTIGKLTNWLGWQWNDVYLNHHDAKHAINTASLIQVRSPINTNSLEGWVKYSNLLQPAIDILESNNLHQRNMDIGI